MTHYDYLIVGSGLYGATFAYKAKLASKKVLVIDKRSHLGGNIYCEELEGINVHKYGAHIFHTNNKKVWDFVNSIVEFNRYTNCPVANYKGELYNLPFNMNTFNRMWPEVHTPAQAQAKIDEQKVEAVAALGGREPQNLEEQALCLVGKDTSTNLSKNIQKSSGEETVRSFRLLLSGDFRFVLRTTIITLTTGIRAFQSAAIRRWWRSCSTISM